MLALLKIPNESVTLLDALKDILSGVRFVIYSRFPRLAYKKALAGNKGAQCFLGLRWATGIEKPKANVPADFMFACYAAASHALGPVHDGTSQATYILGVLYEEGIGVRMDKAKAAEYCRKAAEAGIVTIRDLVGHTKYDAECDSSCEDLNRTMLHGFVNANIPSYWGH